MINKNFPYYPLVMVNHAPAHYPQYTLPAGYEFVFYREGDEERWADIELSVGQFTAKEEALDVFCKNFVCGQTLDPRERMLFVRDGEGDYVATATLWDGKHIGTEQPCFHWLAVKDTCTGRGIAKALMARLLALYFELGCRGEIYLLTGTHYYPAVPIYKRCGFVYDTRDRFLPSGERDTLFAERTAKAIAIVEERLGARE